MNRRLQTIGNLVLSKCVLLIRYEKDDIARE